VTAVKKPKQRESKLLAQIRLAVGKRDDVMLLRINTGVFRPIGGDQKRAIRSAPNGTPDLIGIVSAKMSVNYTWSDNPFQPLSRTVDEQVGLAFAIETKTERGKQSKAQKDFQTAWEARGGIYLLPTSVEAVLGFLSVVGKRPLRETRR